MGSDNSKPDTAKDQDQSEYYEVLVPPSFAIGTFQHDLQSYAHALMRSPIVYERPSNAAAVLFNEDMHPRFTIKASSFLTSTGNASYDEVSDNQDASFRVSFHPEMGSSSIRGAWLNDYRNGFEVGTYLKSSNFGKSNEVLGLNSPASNQIGAFLKRGPFVGYLKRSDYNSNLKGKECIKDDCRLPLLSGKFLTIGLRLDRQFIFEDEQSARYGVGMEFLQDENDKSHRLAKSWLAMKKKTFVVGSEMLMPAPTNENGIDVEKGVLSFILDKSNESVDTFENSSASPFRMSVHGRHCLKSNESEISLSISQCIPFLRTVLDPFEDLASIQNTIVWCVEHRQSIRKDDQNKSKNLSTYIKKGNLCASLCWQANKGLACKINANSDGAIEGAFIFRKWTHPMTTFSLLGGVRDGKFHKSIGFTIETAKEEDNPHYVQGPERPSQNFPKTKKSLVGANLKSKLSLQGKRYNQKLEEII